MELQQVRHLARLAALSARAVAAYRGVGPVPMPVNVTFSVTNRCQSRCANCMIWKLYRDEPERADAELTLDEVRRTFQSMGHTYFFNVSGGEPFLRGDLPEIIEAACRYLKPAVVHIPTNALAVSKVVAGVQEILAVLERESPRTLLTLKPSFDGLHEAHDAIRGVKGNFDKVLRLLDELAPLRRANPRFKVGLGTVVSTANVDKLEEIADYVDTLDVDSYISEIAEIRSEMFNEAEGITPDADSYEAAMRVFKRKTEAMLTQRKGLARVTLAFRLYYYDLVVRILREGRQVLPCYAGITNVHLSPTGDVWPCCIRGYEGSFGNLRDHGFDFFSVWRSPRADEVRRSIRAGECHCPLANQAYANMLLSPEAMRFVMKRMRG